ncbi:MAG TPA: CUAEP/CCAEP-tail radical SAM protein [Vicinamibacterales bacterium]|nr:CUAEP/CCAEP-tail radical SAM protein [Vicinamibacterales bacterium]
MQALLISTYDLGRQPFGLASPAAWLRRAGLEVFCLDASREELYDDRIATADLIAFYLPMHTATRLAAPLLTRVQSINPRARVAAYGLYAPLNADWLRERGVDDVIGPEAEEELVRIANSQLPARNSQATPTSQLLINAQLPNAKAEGRKPEAESLKSTVPRLAFIQPDRQGLAPLAAYASLHMPDGQQRIVGNTDATRGCKHLCRHCPIVPVYQGAFRVVPIDVVMADIRAQIQAGAEHISFGDPDFFNGPTHARRLVEQLAIDHPGVSYDVTIKIEHLLTHADLLPVLTRTGCLFVTSAVESVDDSVLARLRKGHTRADFERAVGLCRAAGLALSPTFVAFTPWTDREGYLDLLRTIASLGLIEEVAPIQLAIRLLITSRSALLDLPEIRDMVGAFDPGSLTYPWHHADPAVDALQQQVMALIASDGHAGRRDAFAAIWDVAHAHSGRQAPPLPAVPAKSPAYISEPWYCCAEPAEFHL